MCIPIFYTIFKKILLFEWNYTEDHKLTHNVASPTLEIYIRMCGS
jgi:hypothetical protein